MVNGVVNGWMICDTSIIFQTFSLLFALHETGYRKASEMEVPGNIVSGRDHGKTQILCSRQVSQFRRSWVNHERSTAILVGSMLTLIVR